MPARPTFRVRLRAALTKPETVYWEDMRRNRANAWALYGLMQALKAQN